MQTNSLKKEVQAFGYCLMLMAFSPGKSFAQEKVDCSCPMFKGKILVDNSYETMGGKLIPRAEIKSKRTAVFSVSGGIVTSIDTSVFKRVYIQVEYLKYTFWYENLLTTECFVGQNIEIGKLLGKVEKGEHLFISISDGKNLLHPETVLPCKRIRVN